jgi:hypothetical protein
MTRRRPSRAAVAASGIVTLAITVLLIVSALSPARTDTAADSSNAAGTAAGLATNGSMGPAPTGSASSGGSAGTSAPAPGTQTATRPGTAPATPPTISADAAFALLAQLLVKGRAPQTGYDRTGQFGEAWLDVDRNGCDTRNDILVRDLTAVTRESTCTVLRGLLVDPYTGTSISFVRGTTTSSAVQIDHVVALLDAWETGAQQLTAAQRVAFANDPRNLLAVGGSINQSKGAGDAATWLPPNKAFRCNYVARQIVVKAAYQLWVTPAEHDAMALVLAPCRG